MIKVPLAVKIGVLTLIATAFYTYVGQLVPQKEVQPPEVIELSEEMTTADLVEIGEEIFRGKGTCATCHTIGQSGALRFPDLAGIATRAAERVPQLDALEYLAQSLYQPETYIVAGFPGGMPAIDQPPIGLTDAEIRAVLAYLQTLGGEATISMQTRIPFSGAAPADEATGEAAPQEVAEAADGTDEEETPPAPGEGTSSLAARYGCADCHGDRATSLAEIGARLSEREIFDALASHEQLGGAAELRQRGYFDSATLGELKSLASFVDRGGADPATNAPAEGGETTGEEEGS